MEYGPGISWGQRAADAVQEQARIPTYFVRNRQPEAATPERAPSAAGVQYQVGGGGLGRRLYCLSASMHICVSYTLRDFLPPQNAVCVKRRCTQKKQGERAHKPAKLVRHVLLMIDHDELFRLRLCARVGCVERDIGVARTPRRRTSLRLFCVRSSRCSRASTNGAEEE